MFMQAGAGLRGAGRQLSQNWATHGASPKLLSGVGDRAARGARVSGNFYTPQAPAVRRLAQHAAADNAAYAARSLAAPASAATTAAGAATTGGKSLMPYVLGAGTVAGGAYLANKATDTVSQY